MKKIIKQLLVLSCMIIMLTSPYFVFAKGENNPLMWLEKLAKNTQYDTENTDGTTVSKIAGDVVAAALSLVGVIFILFTIYGGYLWMTDQGNEEQVEKAKKIIKNSIIGLVIVVSSYAIYKVIEKLFTKTLN